MTNTTLCTVDEFFTWYTGEDWRTTYETTNTLSINGLHAQDASPNGKAAMAFLIKHEDEAIEISALEEPHAWLLEFGLLGNIICVQAAENYTKA
jgi:hypothetical protein